MPCDNCCNEQKIENRETIETPEYISLFILILSLTCSMNLSRDNKILKLNLKEAFFKNLIFVKYTIRQYHMLCLSNID